MINDTECTMIPSAFAMKHNILPIRRDESNTLLVAMEDPSDMIVIDAIRNQTGMSVRAYIAQSQELAQAIQIAYATAPSEPIDTTGAAAPALTPLRLRLAARRLRRGCTSAAGGLRDLGARRRRRCAAVRDRGRVDQDRHPHEELHRARQGAVAATQVIGREMISEGRRPSPPATDV